MSAPPAYTNVRSSGLDPSIERRERGSMFLRQADALMRGKRFLEALEAIQNAKIADPTNAYSAAYEARVREAIEMVPAEPIIGIFTDRVVQHIKAAEAFLRARDYDRALGEVARAFAINPVDQRVERMKNAIMADLGTEQQATMEAIASRNKVLIHA